jgi:hypothetical protein
VAEKALQKHKDRNWHFMDGKIAVSWTHWNNRCNQTA